MDDLDGVEYIPEFDDNRDLPEDEQVILTLQPMTGGEFRKYTRSANHNKTASLEKVMQKIIGDRVSQIKNYSDIRGKAIETGADLFERGEISFIDEIFSALTEISTLKAGLRKK
tara:strand:- start:259 stop:600 length:342 start_codon:yes stop_codon:yes gene_type:complete